MKKNESNFDIAFSFINRDEEIALQLNDLLKDRFKCFIYTEQQTKLAGTNGETTFNRVFSKESKIVVILYRMEWGTTNWTRIEETAIRNRGFEEGYDFVLLIPLDDMIVPPSWLPKNRIWFELNRYGIKDAASVIEARVSEIGGNVREDSIAEKIATLESEKQRDNDRFLKSAEGKKAGFDEFEAILKNFKAKVYEIKSRNPKWHLHVQENNQNGINLKSYGYQLSIKFCDDYSIHPYMSIALYRGYFDAEGRAYFSNSDKQIIDRKEYKFDINKSGQKGWLEVKTHNKFITTSSLIIFWFEKLMKYSISRD